MKLNGTTKLILIILFLAISLYGFLIKLPVPFRKIDKEMHTLFYFLAAAFLNILLAKTNFLIHIAIFFALMLFGYGIEYAQEYSNTFLHKRIHGRFDIEDIRANNKGLYIFSAIWVAVKLFQLAFTQPKTPTANENQY